MTNTEHGYPSQSTSPAVPYGPPPQQTAVPQMPAAPLPPTKRSSRPLLVATAATLATILVLAFGGYAAWANFIREDSGVAACKTMRDNGDKIGKSGASSSKEKVTETEYRAARKQFEDSKKPKIREHGTALMDLVWQLQQIPDGEEMGALAFIGPLGNHISGLQTACADEGIIVNLSK